MKTLLALTLTLTLALLLPVVAEAQGPVLALRSLGCAVCNLAIVVGNVVIVDAVVYAPMTPGLSITAHLLYPDGSRVETFAGNLTGTAGIAPIGVRVLSHALDGGEPAGRYRLRVYLLHDGVPIDDESTGFYLVVP